MEMRNGKKHDYSYASKLEKLLHTKDWYRLPLDLRQRIAAYLHSEKRWQEYLYKEPRDLLQEARTALIKKGRT